MVLKFFGYQIQVSNIISAYKYIFFRFAAAFMKFSAMCVVISLGFAIFPYTFLLIFLHREHYLKYNKNLRFSGWVAMKVELNYVFNN